MKSTKHLTTFQEVSREINVLIDAVNSSERSVGYGGQGKSGDIRLTSDDRDKAYLEVKGDRGWYTTFQDFLTEKPAKSRPYPHFERLDVDNFYAKNVYAQSIRTVNGAVILSDSGIVVFANETEFEIKNSNDSLLSPFKVGDLLYTAKFDMDGATVVKELRLDVTAVNGNIITYTESSESGGNIPAQIGSLEIGDVLVRLGNNDLATNPDRGSVIVMMTSDVRDLGAGNRNFAPYIKILTVISTYSGYFNAVPAAQLGLLGTINDTDFSALYGSDQIGLYTSNAYLKGKLQIGSRSDIIGADWIISTRSSSAPSSPLDGDLWYNTTLKKLYRWDATIGTPAWVDISERQVESFYSATAPTSPLPGDLWFDTTVTVNQLKRWNGASWDGVGANGTYIDNTGVYTSTVAANQVIAGELIGFTIKGNSTPSTSGGVYIDQDEIILYKAGTVGVDDFLWKVWNSTAPIMSWESTGFGVSVSLGAVQGATPIPDGLQCSGRLLAVGGFEVDTLFDVDASGNITKVNNVTYSFPSVAPTLNQVLTCSNATGGVLSWSTPAAGGWTATAVSAIAASLTNTAGTLSVTNDGHSHTSSTISGLAVANFSSPNISNWTNDSGYLTTSSEGWRATDVTSIAASLTNTAGALSVTGYNNTNWDTAYGWGNHASAGYLTAAITSLGGLTVATQTFAVGTSGTAPAFSSVTSTHTLNIPMAATASVTAGLISKTEYDTFNGKATAAYGAEDASTWYVASSSGGSPTKFIDTVAVTINGTTYHLLFDPNL